MDQILNPFDTINQLSKYERFRKIVINIKDKQLLLEISKMLDDKLKEFK